jgi:hypothetical protein
MDSNGYIYIADTENYRMQMFDSGGNFILEWEGSRETGAGNLGYPEDITVDDYGRAYINDHSTCAVYKYVFDRQPPIITINPFTGNSATTNRPQITGTAQDLVSVVLSVQYQIDSITDSWKNCNADDGVFDEKTEDFTCGIDEDLSEGNHTIYVRALDGYTNINFTQDGSETAVGEYDFIVELLADSGNEVYLFAFLGSVMVYGSAACILQKRRRVCRV